MNEQKSAQTSMVAFAVTAKILIICAAVLVLIFILLLFVFTAYSDYDSVTVQNIDYEYNRTFKKAFADAYFWNGSRDSMELTVADSVEGTDVTCLGNPSSGPTHAFLINLPDEMYPEGSFLASSAEEYNDDDYETLVFTVNIGKNISEIAEDEISPEKCGYQYVIDESQGEDGNYTYDVIYRIVYRFNVDPASEYFYSEDGRLYGKSSGELVDIFDYGD